MTRTVAVVTIAHGRHDHLRRQLESLATGSTQPDHHVLVAMSDPDLARQPAHVVHLDSTGPLPLARARNLGARTALGLGADTLVFLDVDCLAGPDLVAAYDEVVRLHPETIWSGPVTYLGEGVAELPLPQVWHHDDPHPARPAPAAGQVQHDADPRLFWSLSFAVDRDTWLAAGGFCEDYVGYGAEDTDFAFQAADRGVRFGWVGAARAYHQHHPTHDPPTQHVDDIVRNAGLFHERWGHWPMEGWLQEFERLGLVRAGADGWVRE